MRAKVKVVKNKVASPFKVAEFDIMFDGTGISTEGDALDFGVEHGLVTKSGTWFSCGDVRLGQGRENARRFLHENVDIRDRIISQVREKMDLIPGESHEKSGDIA